MPRYITEAVNDLCLAFPEAERRISHGTPEYHVRGRGFASYAVNHHGDGRIALSVRAPAGAQTLYVEMEPDCYFVPPYIGPKGWLGIRLDRDLPWHAVCERVREAYLEVAPRSLAREVVSPVEVEPPDDTVPAEEFDPLSVPHAQAKLAELRARALALPEASQGSSFGQPVFKAGKKTFMRVQRRRRRMEIEFWVGGEGQALLGADPRYRIPPYTGHNGWIALDVETEIDWNEVSALMLKSYRHFALKRMLEVLSEP